MKKHHKLTPGERDLLTIWYSQGISIRQIATRLNYNPSTISREINRNSFQGHYVPIHAQAQSSRRKSLAGKRHPLKNPRVFRWVIQRLIRGWSPEQISGRMKLVYPHDPVMRIHHETIYRFIYSEEYKHRAFWEYLPWKRKRRKKKRGRNIHRSRIPDRVSIHERSEMIDAREEFGHWEGDTLMGKRRGLCLQTEVERKSRFLQARLKHSTNAASTLTAQHQIFSRLPKASRKSTTLDNGKEFVRHTQLRERLRMDTYFADPYSAWQRGTNEHHNGLLRRYLPKRISFDDLTQEELEDMVAELNNRPRKCLGFYTPKEVFLKELKSAGVAIPLRM